MEKVPFNKELRELYPYAVDGHKKNCTCFVCNVKRFEMWAKDNPIQSQMATDQIVAKLLQEQATINETKSNALVAKANRNKALVGNKYYKLDGDSIHCADCGQRLGGLIERCPLDKTHKGYVYGKMLNNPADPRWSDPLYNKSKFLTRYNTSSGSFVEVSSAEQGLTDRMQNFGNEDDLI